MHVIVHMVTHISIAEMHLDRCARRKARFHAVSEGRLEVMTSLQKERTLDFHIIFQLKEPELVEEIDESGLRNNNICDKFQET